MLVFQILEATCSGDIGSCCSDYGLAMFLNIMKKAMTIIHIIVPIILIVMCSIDFVKMVISPDDQNKAKSKSTINKFIAAILVFFIPFIMDLVIGIVPDSFEISGCWEAADDEVTAKTEIEDEINNPDAEVETTTQSTKKNQVKDNTDGKKTTGSKKKDTSKNKKNVTGAKVSKYAKKFKGGAYKWGGSWNGESPYVATDCSGFVSGVYKHFGYSLPRTSAVQAASNKYQKVAADDSTLSAGDLLFYTSNGKVSHVAMYIGNGKIIHASNPRTGVKISNYNYRKPLFARRII